MLNHDYNTALGGSAADRAALLTALMKRSRYEIGPAENPQALDFTGADVLAVSYNGIGFEYDAADSTTVHDGVTCIVTADGKRYKSDAYTGRPIRTYVIEDKDLTAPPGSPVIGQHYIVAAGGTGDWAGKDDEIASYTARGWRFIQPAAYDGAFIKDETAHYHLSAGGVWTQGRPGLIIGAASVGLTELELGLGLAVENQTTDTPPGSPTAGAAYVIGPSPTGAWAGHPRKLARYEDSAWVIRTPQNGWMVRDKSTSSVIVYDGSAWVNVSAGVSAMLAAQDATERSATLTNSTAYNYDPTSAPNAGTHRHVVDDLTLNHAAVASGRKLVIDYQVASEINANAGRTTMAIFRDAETAPLAYSRSPATITTNVWWYHAAKFVITTDDAANHEYKARLFFNTTGGSVVSLAGSVMQLTELSG